MYQNNTAQCTERILVKQASHEHGVIVAITCGENFNISRPINVFPHEQVPQKCCLFTHRSPDHPQQATPYEGTHFIPLENGEHRRGPVLETDQVYGIPVSA